MSSLTTYSRALSESEMLELQVYLRDHNYEFQPPPPHAKFAAKNGQANIVAYESRKLVIQGKGTSEFVEFVLEPLILRKAELGYEDVLNPDRLIPRIGVDESGKGDFFGPLCIAGVYVNETVVREWNDAGIQDSKNISSDRKMADLSKRIRETRGCVWNVVPIGNEAYNRLYKKLKSVNQILAWGHARVIENLMLKAGSMDPKPVRAISDQFAYDKETVARALMQEGQSIELIQRHKAEADIAVAAASILARHEFVSRLSALERELKVKLPKGASTAVDATAKVILQTQGQAVLDRVCKTHFRTWLRAMDLPEPPKTEWKRPSAPKPKNPSEQ